jgi:hypothetical protein
MTARYLDDRRPCALGYESLSRWRIHLVISGDQEPIRQENCKECRKASLRERDFGTR